MLNIPKDYIENQYNLQDRSPVGFQRIVIVIFMN